MCSSHDAPPSVVRYTPSRPPDVTRPSAPSSGTTYATSGSRGSSAIGKPKPLGIGGIELDRVQAGAAEARRPPVARRVLEQCAVRFPGLTAVVGAEEHVRIAAGPQRVRL